jgi:hypothetical protein
VPVASDNTWNICVPPTPTTPSGISASGTPRLSRYAEALSPIVPVVPSKLSFPLTTRPPGQPPEAPMANPSIKVSRGGWTAVSKWPLIAPAGIVCAPPIPADDAGNPPPTNPP